MSDQTIWEDLSRLVEKAGTISPVSFAAIKQCEDRLKFKIPMRYRKLLTVVGPFMWIHQDWDGVYIAGVKEVMNLTILDQRCLKDLGELPERKFATIAFSDYYHFLLYDGELCEMAILDVESSEIRPFECGLHGFLCLAIQALGEEV